MDNEDDLFDTMPIFREKGEEEEESEVYFNENQLNEFEECFKKIDKTGNGTVLIGEIGPLLRASGMNPSLRIIKDITEWFEMNDIKRINYRQYLKLLKNSWKEVDPFEIRTAIEVFDPSGNGYMTIDQLKNTLLNLGENLDEEDFKEFIKALNVQPDGIINNEDIVQLLTTNFK